MNFRFWIAVAFISASSPAFAEALPSTAKKATIGDLRALTNKKRVMVDVFDLGEPVRGDLVWDWRKNLITGTAVINNKKTIKVRNKMHSSGDKACSDNKDGKLTCRDVYIDGNKFYEVNDDGSLHAASDVGG